MARLRIWRWRLRRFVRVGGHARLLLLEASVWLLVSRLALVLIPFPRLAPRLGAVMRPAEARARQAVPVPEEAALAREIGWAVTRAARHVPFRAVCLPQAMAARIMLSRRGIKSVLHFGAGRGKEKPLDAHAWLDAAGVEVTGYPVDTRMAEIACFV